MRDKQRKNNIGMIEEWKENANKMKTIQKLRATERGRERENGPMKERHSKQLQFFVADRNRPKKATVDVENDSSHISKQTNTKQAIPCADLSLPAQLDRLICDNGNCRISQQQMNVCVCVQFMIRLGRSIIVWN